MAHDDRRMHEGRSRSLDDREPHRGRVEEEVFGVQDHLREGDDVPSDTDRDQEGALGGHVATRSSTAETPKDERD